MHANWVQKSLENATWDPFGTKSRPGRLQDAQGEKNYYSKVALLGRKCRSKARLWVQSGSSNGSKNVTLTLDWHLDPRKMSFWEWCLKTSEI